MAHASRFVSLVLALAAMVALLAPVRAMANPVGPSDPGGDVGPTAESIRHAHIGGMVVARDPGSGRAMPVAGARVELIGRDGSTVQVVRSDREGNFRFDAVRPGPFVVRAGHPDFGRGQVRLNALPGRNMVRVPIG
ncbi:MAG: carboxypeptidase regulatory-like domain-containing protein [Phycisphaeraceae bacterium]|nr:carboxypeptidase regulatory-like domain-containing protein [Phycisphaeraceae bacterium]MCW5755001.1 carboxypeptidase regulatory-like domain-containing protein [Phycisphaeraceae bacterium]